MKLPAQVLPNASAEQDCVLFPGALGDFVCFLPALQQLAKERALDLFARTEYADLVTPTISVRSSECPEIAGLFIEGGAKNPDLQKFFSCYRNIYSWMGSSVATFARQLHEIAPARAFIFPFHSHGGVQHQIDYYLSCIGDYGQSKSAAVIPLSPLALSWCDNLAERYRLGAKPVLVIAPGSGALEKNWPIKCFRRVSEWWQREERGIVLTLLGPVEADRGGMDDLSRDTLALRDVTLAQCAALLSRCQLYLGNDSGITHLAAAVAVPTIALFGPSKMMQWSPRGQSVTVMSLNVECSPCATEVMKGCPHRKCMTTLSAESVISQLEQIPR